MSTTRKRRPLRRLAVLTVLLAVGCDSNPTGPSAPSAPPDTATTTAPGGQAKGKRPTQTNAPLAKPD